MQSNTAQPPPRPYWTVLLAISITLLGSYALWQWGPSVDKRDAELAKNLVRQELLRETQLGQLQPGPSIFSE